MSNPPNPQSQKRIQESLGALFLPEKTANGKHLLFLKSSSDIGVIRNGGRNGSRFAPQSFLSYFKKLNQDPITSTFTFSEVEVSHSEEERSDFSKAQTQESERIFSHLKDTKEQWLCHLGGGHDHIFPLLLAFSRSFQHIIVINIDAHADTRTDENHHSGTPFRQFASSYKGKFELYQVGLHPFANSQSTLSPLLKGQSRILWRNELQDNEKKKNYFQQLASSVTQDTLVLFSLDADALAASEVPGVSAVNGHGITRQELDSIWKEYINLPFRHAPIMGLYELNPVYDTLSMVSMRTLASFLYEQLR